MKDSKNLVIGMLCAVVCIMAVAYAAFSTTLEINGTASISSTWDVKITSATCEEIHSVSGVEGSVSAGFTTLEDYKAEFAMKFTQPGDWAECEVIYTNNGSLDAELTHVVTATNGAPVTGTEWSNANIKFTITGANESQTLKAKDAGVNTHTIKVKGEFLDVEGGQSDATAKSASIKIVSTAVQAGL